jgi:hypothetical protein
MGKVSGMVAFQSFQIQGGPAWELPNIKRFPFVAGQFPTVKSDCFFIKFGKKPPKCGQNS